MSHSRSHSAAPPALAGAPHAGASADVGDLRMSFKSGPTPVLNYKAGESGALGSASLTLTGGARGVTLTVVCCSVRCACWSLSAVLWQGTRLALSGAVYHSPLEQTVRARAALFVRTCQFVLPCHAALRRNCVMWHAKAIQPCFTCMSRQPHSNCPVPVQAAGARRRRRGRSTAARTTPPTPRCAAACRTTPSKCTSRAT